MKIARTYFAGKINEKYPSPFGSTLFSAARSLEGCLTLLRSSFEFSRDDRKHGTNASSILNQVYRFVKPLVRFVQHFSVAKHLCCLSIIRTRVSFSLLWTICEKLYRFSLAEKFTEKRLIPFTKVSLLFHQFYFSIWKHAIYYDNTFTYARASALRIVGKRIKRDDRWRWPMKQAKYRWNLREPLMELRSRRSIAKSPVFPYL